MKKHEFSLGVRTTAALGLAALLFACGRSDVAVGNIPVEKPKQEAVVVAEKEPEKEEEHAHGVRKPLPSAAEIATLPSDGGEEFNRLVFSASPYLLQHARNPVDWQPWGDEAFALAKKLDKPVFLSVGYATCHWCHVMEHESFEDPAIAKLMNEHFVCVKVDREERPDVDQVYMSVTQMMTGSGGWPMTVVLTPERKPFFAGTYFPKEGRYGRPGMAELVPALSKAWKDDREKVLEAASRAVDALKEMNAASPADGRMPDATTLDTAYEELAGRFDSARGGFGRAPKFPTPHQLTFLLRQDLRRDDGRALQMVEKTLQAMRQGGIFDHVGYGFHRYSTDADWLLPHFEKMLYDQAMIAIASLEAWQLTSDPQYAEIARKIFTYVSRDMTHENGGFFSAEDADSEGEEGKFYVWTTKEIRSLLPKADAALYIEVFNLADAGNFHDESTGEFTGANIPHLKRSLSKIAKEKAMPLVKLEQKLEAIRARLFAVREKRIHPLKDDKILTDWNGLMIAAYARGGRTLADPDLTRRAIAAADFVWENLRTKEGRLLKRWRNGNAGLTGLIDDYAFMVWGLIELYETTHDTRFLARAVELHKTMRTHFADSANGGFFQTPDDGEALLVRAREIYDGAIPSGNSVAACNALRLARMTGGESLGKDAEGIFRSFAGKIARGASSHSQLMSAIDFASGPTHEVVIVAPDAAAAKSLLTAAQAPFLPRAVLLLRTPQNGAELDRLAPYTSSMVDAADGPSAFVCRNFACQLPTSNVKTMLKHLGIPRK